MKNPIYSTAYVRTQQNKKSLSTDSQYQQLCTLKLQQQIHRSKERTTAIEISQAAHSKLNRGSQHIPRLQLIINNCRLSITKQPPFLAQVNNIYLFMNAPAFQAVSTTAYARCGLESNNVPLLSRCTHTHTHIYI